MSTTYQSMKEQLDLLLDDMIVPALRRDDPSWLQRNLHINNGDHPQLTNALEAVRWLIMNPDTFAPDCAFGYSMKLIESKLTAAELESFNAWIKGQTIGICDGFQFNHDTEQYELSACGNNDVIHGAVVYAHDFDHWNHTR